MAADFIDKLIDRTRTTISRWQGKVAVLHSLSSSHPILKIVVHGESRDKNLVIACIDPEYVSGPVRWSSSDIVLEKIQLKNGDEGVSLVDAQNGVRVISGSVEIKENVRL